MMQSGPIVVEKLHRPFIKTKQNNALISTDFPENELSVAQKLARRYIRHQKLQDALSQYGIASPTEISFAQSFNSMPVSGRKTKREVPKNRRSRSLDRQRPRSKPVSSARSSPTIEQPRKVDRQIVKSPLRDCDVVSHQFNYGKVERTSEVSSAEQEINQMRRAIKFYTDRLLALKANAATEQLTSSTKERCLNAQVSRQLYSLTRQLSNCSNCYSSNMFDKPRPISSTRQAGLSLQQLNSIHKSAIRCLSSFVHQHDQFAQDEEKRRETTGSRRSPSPLPPPLPSAVLYSQLCSLLEKLAVCYNAHTSAYDPDFAESIRQLKPSSSPTPRSKMKKKAPLPSSSSFLLPFRKRKNTSAVERSQSSNSNRVRFEKHEEIPHFRTVDNIFVKDNNNERLRDGSTQTTSKKNVSRKPIGQEKSASPAFAKPCNPLLQHLLANTSGQTASPYLSPPRRRPTLPKPDNSSCNFVDFDIESIRARLEKMEMEATAIRQKWLSRTHEQDFLVPVTTIFPEKKNEPPLILQGQPEAKSATPIVPVQGFADDESSYFNRIVDIVQNRVFEEVIQDSLTAEFDRFESIADQLVEHLLQTELLICS